MNVLYSITACLWLRIHEQTSQDVHRHDSQLRSEQEILYLPGGKHNETWHQLLPSCSAGTFLLLLVKMPFLVNVLLEYE